MSMSSFNPNPKNQSDNPKPRKPRPGYKRIVVGYRLVAMQASHVDAIARAEGGAGSLQSQPRCPKCFLLLRHPEHFCRWNIEREGPGRDRNPAMRKQPIFQWVKDD
jgi:hypothetical protein